LSEAQKSLVIKAHQARQLKLESSVATENGRWSAVDSSARYESPGASLEADDERRILLNRMERLDDRERTILALRYGLEGESPLTLKEIGRRLGVTREWVRKIELRALRKMDPEHAENPGFGSNGLNPARATRRSRSAGSSQAVAPVFSSAPVEQRAPVSLRSRSFLSAARVPAQPGVVATPAF
jgi:DNA-binding CsgD family transcriptional regulator